MQLTDITLAILAGGAGSRMGAPKGNLRIAGQPILGWLLDQICWPGPTMLVTAPGVTDPPGARRFDRQAVDPVAGLGPLRGVLTALEQSVTSLVCVTTVDMPGVRPEMLSLLTEAMVRGDGRKNANIERQTSNVEHRSEDLLGVMLERCDSGHRQIEPFPSVLHVAAREVIRSRLDAGRRSVHALCDDPRFISITAPAAWPTTVWTNLNTPDDLQAFHGTVG